MPLQFVRTSLGIMVPVEGDASGRASVALHGWYSSAWQKGPLPFGPSGSLIKRYSNTNLSAGTNNLDSDSVPTGELWCITNLSFVYVGTVPGAVLVQFVSGSDTPIIYRIASPASVAAYDKQGLWVLASTQSVRATVTGATAGDDLYLDILGYTMDMDQ